MKLTFSRLEDYDNLPEITSPNIFISKYGKRFYHPQGIFSEQIFGPEKDYECQCGKYKGREYTGHVCERCGVLVEKSDLRRKIFAVINLNDIYVFDPLLFEILQLVVPRKLYTFKSLKTIITSTSDFIIFRLHKESKVVSILNYLQESESLPSVLNITEDGFHYTTKDQITEDDSYYYGFGQKFLLHALNIWSQEYKNIKSFLEVYKDRLLINKIIVAPPALRPLNKIGKDVYEMEKSENKYYINILRQKQILDKAILMDQVRPSSIADLQKHVFDLYDVLLSKFGKKEGLLRKYILGKRVDYSGRAVIAPDPTIPFGYISIPLIVAREMFAPMIIQDLARALDKTSYEVVNKRLFVDPRYDDVMLKILNDKFRGEYIVMNRQPTLHRPSIQAFKIWKIVPEDVIFVHPLITSPYGADFDGDSINSNIDIEVFVKDGEEGIGKNSLNIKNIHILDLKDLEI